MHEVWRHHSGNGRVGLKHRYLTVWVESVLPTGQHEGTVASYVKVAQYFIGAPASDEADGVGVDASTQEGHGTRRS
jgi:hypothetical protein